MIGYINGHSWRATQRFVHPAKIEERDPRRHGCLMILKLFAESVG